ncbi:MAG TPA: FAD-dependent oxidoreductase [Candidatus Nitrosocosmicus sp.]|nr:FAD-dependent oxidoreductase [Candidatus Nitrosocosmicus sp.]
MLYLLRSVEFIDTDTFILKIVPKKGEVFQFKPGQYIQISAFDNIRSFSIASSPHTRDYLELCIRIYGGWTRKLSELDIGSEISIDGPFGTFTWSDLYTNNVFLIGGIGISPIMSMIREMEIHNKKVQNVILYGNRTTTIPYKKELDNICSKLHYSIQYILSAVGPNEKWNDYKGFINEEILLKEANLESKPTFFISGPPVFIELMKKILIKFNIESEKIKYERPEK